MALAEKGAGILCVSHVALLAADAWGKAGFSGIAAGNAVTTVTCLAMIFERSVRCHDAMDMAETKKPPRLSGAFRAAVNGYKKSPVLWTSLASSFMKTLMVPYGLIHGETYFLPAIAAGILGNVAVAAMDNSVQRFFGLTPPPAAPRTPLPHKKPACLKMSA